MMILEPVSQRHGVVRQEAQHLRYNKQRFEQSALLAREEVEELTFQLSGARRNILLPSRHF